MKDHNDVIKRVFHRRDEYYTKQKKRKRIALNTISFFCIVALITTGAWHIGFFDKAPQNELVNKPHQTISPGFKTPNQPDGGSYGGVDPNTHTSAESSKVNKSLFSACITLVVSLAIVGIACGGLYMYKKKL